MLIRTLARRTARQDGFTVVEGMIAAFVLVVGILGGIGVFDSSGRESATGERQQVAVAQAEAELERLRDLPYDELAIDPAQDWLESAQPGDPTNRVTEGTPPTFTVASGHAEELIVAGAGGSGVEPYTAVEVPAGENALELGIYRFVSWRDENCEIVELGGLTGGLNELLDNLEAGGGGAQDLIDDLVGPGSRIGNLLGLLLTGNPIYDDLEDADAALDDLAAALGAREDDLQAAIAGIEEVDPCDLDLETLTALQGTDTFSTVNPALEQLDSALDTYDNSCVPVLHICTGPTAPVLAAIANVLALDLDQVGEDLDAVVTALGELDGLSDNPRNTKRLTVAVVIEPRTGTGPTKPIWATSVASDPAAGLGTP